MPCSTIEEEEEEKTKCLRVTLLMANLLTLLLEMLVAQYQGNTTLVIHTKWQKLNNLYC
jgi:hypothetical protein